MNPYSVDTSDSNISLPIVSLEILYEHMPDTVGCNKCSETYGEENKDWCCRSNTPSMYYIEFLNAWREVQNHWTKEKRKELVLRAIKNYLSNSRNKPCIFYDGECTIYSKRPYACRIYSIIPGTTWQKRIDALSQQYGDSFEEPKQCGIVRTVDRAMPTEAEEDIWFRRSARCEKELGVPPDRIKRHDLPGGSYRTFHDHLLIELFDEIFLARLSQVRLGNPSSEQIEQFVETIKSIL